MSRRAKLAAATLIATSAACGAPALSTVPRGPQPATALPVAVDYPPPPARIEEIPLSRRAANPCVWRDGYWDWTGRTWEWQEGRAVLAPPGCRFAEAKLAWTRDFLSFFRPAWYPDPGQTPPPKTCTEIACIPAPNPTRPVP